MSRESIHVRLGKAEQQVALSQRSLDRLRVLLGDLDRAGHDTRHASNLVGEYKLLLGLHEDARDEILGEIVHSENVQPHAAAMLTALALAVLDDFGPPRRQSAAG